VREYSPKRRTAVVFTGSGTSGAYHAGVLRAFDESGVKIDVVVGSGTGAVAAAYAAVDGGTRLYGKAGFWHDVEWRSLYRVRPFLVVSLGLLACSFGVFLLPVALGLLAGLLFPLVLIADRAWPGLASRILGFVAVAPESLSGPYLAALAMPIFALALVAATTLAVLLSRERRRIAESFESFLDASPGEARLRRGLWEIVRGAALNDTPPSEAELGRRFVALLSENVGQPGFRELVLRTADLDAAGALPFVVLADEHRAEFLSARARDAYGDGRAVAVDLCAAGYEPLFFDAVAAGILPPVAGPVRRVSFPKGGIFSGETHRLTDGTLVAGAGIKDALAAGAEQVIVVSASPGEPRRTPRRRGPRARLDALLTTLEAQALATDVDETERINRIVGSLGHRTDDGGRAWEDPTSGRLLRELPFWLVRPERRSVGPAELDGARDPATEVVQTTADLLEQGYRDAYRQFVEPVVGAAPVPRREEPRARDVRTQPVEL
jgi:Patatin-like phospholipase